MMIGPVCGEPPCLWAPGKRALAVLGVFRTSDGCVFFGLLIGLVIWILGLFDSSFVLRVSPLDCSVNWEYGAVVKFPRSLATVLNRQLVLARQLP